MNVANRELKGHGDGAEARRSTIRKRYCTFQSENVTEECKDCSDAEEEEKNVEEVREGSHKQVDSAVTNLQKISTKTGPSINSDQESIGDAAAKVSSFLESIKSKDTPVNEKMIILLIDYAADLEAELEIEREKNKRRLNGVSLSSSDTSATSESPSSPDIHYCKNRSSRNDEIRRRSIQNEAEIERLSFENEAMERKEGDLLASNAKLCERNKVLALSLEQSIEKILEIKNECALSAATHQKLVAVCDRLREELHRSRYLVAAESTARRCLLRTMESDLKHSLQEKLISELRHRIQNCLQVQAHAARDAQATQATQDLLISKKDELKNDLALAEGKLSVQHETIERMREDHMTATKRFECSLETSRQELARMQEKHEQLCTETEETEAIKSQLATTQTELNSALHRGKVLTDSLDRATVEVAELKSALNNGSLMIKGLEEKHGILMKDYRAAVQKVAASREETQQVSLLCAKSSDKVSRDLIAAEENIEDLKRKLELVTSELLETRMAVSERQSEMHKVESKNMALMSALEEASSRCALAEAECDAIRSENAAIKVTAQCTKEEAVNARYKLSEMEEQLRNKVEDEKTLTVKLAKAKVTYERAMKAAASQESALLCEKSDLNATNAKLANALKVAQEKLVAREAALEEARNSIHVLERQLAAESNELIGVSENARITREELSETLTLLAEARQKVSSLQRELGTAKKADLSTISNLQMRVETMRDALNGATEETARLKRHLKDKDSKLTKAEEKVRNACRRIENIKRDALGNAKRKVNDLQSQLEAKEESLTNAEEVIEAGRINLDKTKKELHEMGERLQILQESTGRQVQVMQDQLNSKSVELAEMREKLSEAQKDHDFSRSELCSVRLRLECVEKSELPSAQSLSKSLQMQLDACRRQEFLDKDALVSAQGQLLSLQAHLKSKSENLEKANEQLSSSRAQVEKLTAELGEFAGVNSELQSVEERLEANNQDYQQKLLSLQAQLDSKSDEFESANEQLSKVRGHMSHVQTQLDLKSTMLSEADKRMRLFQNEHAELKAELQEMKCISAKQAIVCVLKSKLASLANEERRRRAELHATHRFQKKKETAKVPVSSRPRCSGGGARQQHLALPLKVFKYTFLLDGGRDGDKVKMEAKATR